MFPLPTSFHNNCISLILKGVFGESTRSALGSRSSLAATPAASSFSSTPGDMNARLERARSLRGQKTPSTASAAPDKQD